MVDNFTSTDRLTRRMLITIDTHTDNNLTLTNSPFATTGTFLILCQSEYIFSF